MKCKIVCKVHLVDVTCGTMAIVLDKVTVSNWPYHPYTVFTRAHLLGLSWISSKRGGVHTNYVYLD